MRLNFRKKFHLKAQISQPFQKLQRYKYCQVLIKLQTLTSCKVNTFGKLTKSFGRLSCLCEGNPSTNFFKIWLLRAKSCLFLFGPCPENLNYCALEIFYLLLCQGIPKYLCYIRPLTLLITLALKAQNWLPHWLIYWLWDFKMTRVFISQWYIYVWSPYSAQRWNTEI